MILRQITARHGRSILTSSAQCCRRSYASEISNLGPMYQPSTQDHKPTKSIPGHPSDPSSILDSSTLPPTAASRRVAESLSSIMTGIQSLQNDLNAHISATQSASVPVQKASEAPWMPTNIDPPPFPDLKTYHTTRKAQKVQARTGSHLINVYNPYHIIENPPAPDEITLSMLLANQTHLGHATSLWNPSNSSYIFGIREGIHIISLDITLAYLRRAAKVVSEVARRGGIILFVGTRKGQQEIIINAAKLAESYHIFDRWVPGSLTNGQQILGHCGVKVVNKTDEPLEKFQSLLAADTQHPVLRPDLVVCMNPLENEVCLHECGLYNVPTIGVIDTDANPAWVTYPIPANDDSLRSIALIAGTLGRAGQEGQRLRKESAEQGELTFDTARVQRYLEGMEEIAELGQVDSGTGSKDREKETA